MKLWGGRFRKETDSLVNDFNSSIQFDGRMYREDICGSMAHAKMLADCGIISGEDLTAILAGLQGILEDVEAGKVEFTTDNEDIHMNVETILTARIGDAGKRLHTARSRNDQVAVDFRMYVREEIGEIIKIILDFEKVLVKKAKVHVTTLLPGYTHLQRAQPSTLAHHLMAYANMLKRDVTRLEDCLDRMNECPLGAGALATTTYPINRNRTAELLGFAKPTDNSLDSVSDRDFAIEFLSDMQICNFPDIIVINRFLDGFSWITSWLFQFGHDVHQGRESYLVAYIFFDVNLVSDFLVLDQVFYRTFHVLGNVFHYRITFRMNGRIVERVLGIGDTKETGTLFECLSTHARYFHQFLAGSEGTIFCPIVHDVLGEGRTQA